MKKTKTIYRDAVTGEIVTAKYAKENPDTTVKETIQVKPDKALKILAKYKNSEYVHPERLVRAITDVLEYFDYADV